jgi:hypothetical protein
MERDVNASAQESRQAPAEVDLYAVRATYDMARLRFETLSDKSGGGWLVLLLEPAPNSGSVTLPGVIFEGETGRLIDTETGKEVSSGGREPRVIIAGSWTVTKVSGTSGAASTGEYLWMAPQRSRIRQMQTDDLYSPFVRGGTILCKLHPEQMGAEQFQPRYLLPKGWEAFARSAEEYAGDEFTAGRTGLPQISREQLAILCSGENPILSVMALSALVSALPETDVEWGQIAARDDGRAAAFTFLLLQSGVSDRQMEAFLRWARTPVLYAVSIGILAFALLGDVSESGQERARELLYEVSRRMSPRNAQIVEIFNMLGIPVN